MPQQSAIPNTATIVVIDDDPGFCRTLTDILETRSLHVVAIPDGNKALDMIAANKPAVVLIDLRLPKVSGLKLLEQIKQVSPETECILLTGYASQESAIAAVNLGAFSYLQKPYDLDQLILTVQQAVQKYQGTISLRQRTADLDLINRLNHAANHGASLSELVDILARGVKENFGIFSVTLYLLTPDRTHLEMVQTSPENSYLQQISKIIHTDIPPVRLPLDKVPDTVALIEKKEPTLLEDPKQIEQWISNFVETETLTDLLRTTVRKAIPLIIDELNFAAVLCIPLYSEEGPIGLLDLTSLTPLPAGVVERLTGFIEQLTAILQRKKTEEALARMSHENELILNTMAEGILGLDLLGRHTFVNPTAARMLGYTISELLGQPAHTLWHHHHADGTLYPEEECPIYQTLEQGVVHSVDDDVFWRKDGSIIPVAYTSAPLIEDGEIIGTVVAFRDISAQKEAEAQLQHLLTQVKEQSQQLTEVMDAVPEGVLFLDNQSYIVLANRVAREDLEFLAGAHVGDLLERLGGRPLNELLTSPTKGTWHEVQHEGHIFEVIARPIVTGTETKGWVMVINDVTEERTLQQQVQQQERLAAIGRLAAGIAHDFNNILAVIVLYAKLALRGDDISPTLEDYLQTILEQTKRASNLIQQILDFSRRAVLERQATDLNRFVASQVELLQRTLPEDIDIVWTPYGREAMANIDVTRIQQAILNIAMNARDVMVDGGKLQITLKAYDDIDNKECLTCGRSLTGSWYAIEFTDTGPGIDPEMLPHLFEPFFTTKEGGQGTGLGLAQVFGIMQQHEGHVWVQSQKGKGATFTLLLPAVATSAVPLPETRDDVVVLGHNEIILVVEDDKMVLQALSLTLKDLHYRVIPAAHGREALDILKKHGKEISLVLTDMVMPVMGGKALFYTIKERRYNIPVMIITGHPMEAELEKLRQEGLGDWILKPPDPLMLSQKIARLLRK